MSNNSKTYEVGKFILDSIVPEINVPIMKLSRRKRFNMKKWIENAKTKLSENVERKSSQIANWILNTKFKKSELLAKIKAMMKLVLNSEYSDKPIKKGKLIEKKMTAFKNNAIVYKLKMLDIEDPLNQMMLLNDRKTFLLNKRLIQLKGIKCNETLEVKFEKLGSEGRMIEKSFTFTSSPQVIMNKNDIESALQNMRSDIEVRISRFTMEGSGWAVVGLLNHDIHVNKYDLLAARSYVHFLQRFKIKKPR